FIVIRSFSGDLTILSNYQAHCNNLFFPICCCPGSQRLFLMPELHYNKLFATESIAYFFQFAIRFFFNIHPEARNTSYQE
ncbi:hypothetical protein, partial [Aneurinibacillus tyrosinisolvens]|uniref:hypothetical protein n=1 Tax=Aneurinibacillus tyrosinisolvens TaxID=1443435 RepID=UPI001F3D9AEA